MSRRKIGTKTDILFTAEFLVKNLAALQCSGDLRPMIFRYSGANKKSRFCSANSQKYEKIGFEDLQQNNMSHFIKNDVSKYKNILQFPFWNNIDISKFKSGVSDRHLNYFCYTQNEVDPF
ncbi:hypothetical protein BDA99DRAFT_533192 [Phascolomyces articulosus]|uniref:Uncharacterized protein n=1 Tax=Phascolomyces articulosus TaxID=60185 RepID=A0AAD5K8Z1_9FUNG|nr:hypothetical protein BDA99DRAFT_533192 [Phascolomyces articulosus]